MGKHKLWRYGAFSMAAILGVGTVLGGNVLKNRVFAGDDGVETIVFAEGYGTDSEFKSDSWVFAGLEKDTKADVTKKGVGKAPAIEKDTKYLRNNENVIRLINGVKRNSDVKSGLEDSSSYDAYRSGEAFLSKGIQLKKNAEFSAKFTFSMPEAVVNTKQTGGAMYAREVGGDGIAFVLTTNATHDTQAGSGIGYQGIGQSVAIELDSYFNGAYCEMTAGDYAYKNWGFDNQLYFHKNAKDGENNYGENPYKSGYENYENPNFTERFDHIAITTDGNVKKHIDKYYMAGQDPTKLENGEYINLANRWKNKSESLPRKRVSTEESTSSTCSTRFADKGVDDRLFTVWVDYANNKMNVSIANGDYKTAVKPAKPQISNTVNLDGFDGKTAYMGFTSAIGSSKANHTIHSFSFSNACDATYKLNYYLKDAKTGEYKLDKSSEIFTDAVGTSVTADKIDANYKDAYKDKNYQYSDSAKQETSVELKEKGMLYEMNVYYDPAKAQYKLHYYKWNSQKEKYEEVAADVSDTITDLVGTTHKASEIDSKYETKYPGYKLKETDKTVTEVKLTEAGKVYDMHLYYDPIIAGYKLNYYKKDPVTGDYELVESTKEYESPINKTYTVTDVDPDYKTKYDKDGYRVNEAKNDTYSVKVEKENTIYEMNVYYDPAEAYYLVKYHVWNDEKGEYELKETTPATTDIVGKDVKVSDVDPAYSNKYEGYAVNPKKNDTYEVTLKEAGKTYEMNVYYDKIPETPNYKLNYHKLNPNTEKYEYIESTFPVKGEINQTYDASNADPNYETKYQKDNYVFNPDKKDTFTVKLETEDQMGEMDVYYTPVLTTYKTEYYLKNPDGTYTLKDTVQGEKTYAGKNVTAPEKTYPDYFHVTTPESKEAAVVEPDGSTTMKVYYDPVKKPTYKVEYYVEQPDGSYKLYTDKKDIESETGKKVDAEIITIPGYTHTTTGGTNESDVVREDSSTVLKVYYNITTTPTPVPTEDPNQTGSEQDEEEVPTETPAVTPEPVTPEPETPEPEEPEETEEPEDVEPEEPEEPEDVEPEETEEPVDAEEPATPTPKTGDTSNAGAYWVLMLSSIAVFVITLFSKKKEDEVK